MATKKMASKKTASKKTASKKAPKKKKSNWGGARPGAGRPRNPNPSYVQHHARPPHQGGPVLITLKVGDTIKSLLQPKLAKLINGALDEQRTALEERGTTDFKVTRSSLEAKRLRLLVDADDEVALTRGMMGFMIRTARALNTALGRKGRFWADRYHAKALTPAEHRSLTRELGKR